MTARQLPFLAIAVCATACSPYLHSPPARMLPLETAAALPKGDFAIQVAGGGGAAFWGPSVAGGTLQARVGVGRNVEVSGEGSAVRIGQRDEDWDTTARHSVFAGRAGFKYAATSWFAVQAGFGGGGSAAGGFISPDAGIIFSYQNEKAIPFVAGGFYYSHPINPKPIVFTSDQLGSEVLYPDQTLGGYGNFGVRIPFSHERGDVPRSALMIAYRFVAAAHEEYIGSAVYQERSTDFYNLGIVSLELVFGKETPKPGGGAGRVKIR